MPKIIDQSPSPRSHIKTLMRIGYTLNSAVSDILDNSLAAQASNVHIYAPPGRDHPIFSLLDDGFGMTPSELIHNMRIACKDPDLEREVGDLGRFGSGMKTASFSQARRLTVITKKSGGAVAAARWDIDSIEESDTWCLEVFEESELDAIEGCLLTPESDQGTQVIWEKLTFLEKGSHAEHHDKELASRLSELNDHLALYFHRFMSGRNRLSIFINGLSVSPKDPFMTSADGYQEGPEDKMRCKGGFIEVKTHVLPHFKKMDAKALAEMGGAEKITQGQGLYIYRERRLISSGGWMGMAPHSQLGALARVQVDIPSALDNQWSTDVKKASLQIPPGVKRALRKFLSDPVRRSKRIHQYRGKQESANTFWKITEDEIKGVISYQVDPDNPRLSKVLQSADLNNRRLIVDFLRDLAVYLPVNHIYEKMAERPRDISQEEDNLLSVDDVLNKVFGL